MDLVIFENNKPLVLKALGNGDFDYLEAANEVLEADFFRFIKAGSLLDELSQSYPTPRKKQERCLSGFMSPATCPCGCMGCMLLMRFRWWCAPEGCFRPLGLRRGARWLIRRPGIRP
jgi:hypothetical protein